MAPQTTQRQPATVPAQPDRRMVVGGQIIAGKVVAYAGGRITKGSK